MRTRSFPRYTVLSSLVTRCWIICLIDLPCRIYSLLSTLIINHPYKNSTSPGPSRYISLLHTHRHCFASFFVSKRSLQNVTSQRAWDNCSGRSSISYGTTGCTRSWQGHLVGIIYERRVFAPFTPFARFVSCLLHLHGMHSWRF